MALNLRAYNERYHAAAGIRTVVDDINDGGTAFNSADEIAACYAIDGIGEGAESAEPSDVDYWLRELRSAGAKFDERRAFAMVIKHFGF